MKTKLHGCLLTSSSDLEDTGENRVCIYHRGIVILHYFRSDKTRHHQELVFPSVGSSERTRFHLYL